MRRAHAVPALALAVVLLLAAPAAAHVDLEPTEAVAGSQATLVFSFRHGKDGTATTGLEVLLPEGASVIEVPPTAGWSSAVDPEAGTVRWTGGRVPDGTAASLPVVVQLPATPGVAIFKTIQSTEGGELAWIDEAEGDDEGVNSAPRLTLIADPNPTTTTTTPSTTTTEATTTTEVDDDDERRAGTTLEADQRDDGTSTPAPWLIGSGIAAIVAIGVGGTVLRRRTG